MTPSTGASAYAEATCMTSGTRDPPMPPRIMRSTLAFVVALGLLAVAGAYSGYCADITQDWNIGSRSRVGKDDWRFIGLVGALIWLLLIPGMSLSLGRSHWWRVAAASIGYAVWIVMADTIQIAPAASGLYRALWVGVLVFAVWFFPLLYERRFCP